MFSSGSTGMIGLPRAEGSMMMWNHCDTIPERDRRYGQTDGRMEWCYVPRYHVNPRVFTYTCPGLF